MIEGFRQALAIGIAALVALLLALPFRDRTPGVGARAADFGVDFVVAGRGVLLPESPVAPPAGLGTAIVAGTRLLVERDAAPPGLRVATFGPDLELLDYRSFDVAAGDGAARAFARRIAKVAPPALMAIASAGRIEPGDEADREELRVALETLRARARPFDRTPASWAYLGVVLEDGWHALSEATSGESGVVLAFAVARPLERYRDAVAEFVTVGVKGPRSIALAKDLSSAVRCDPSIGATSEAVVGGVALEGLFCSAGPPRSSAVVEWSEVYLGHRPVLEFALGAPDGATAPPEAQGAVEVEVQGRIVARFDVDPRLPRWRPGRVDLAPFAGERVSIALRCVAAGRGLRPALVVGRPRLLWTGSAGTEPAANAPR